MSLVLSPLSRSPFAHTIGNILGVCPLPQMGRVAARRIVAGMADRLTGNNGTERTIEPLVHHTMGLVDPILKLDYAVPIPIPSAHVRPARARPSAAIQSGKYTRDEFAGLCPTPTRGRAILLMRPAGEYLKRALAPLAGKVDPVAAARIRTESRGRHLARLYREYGPASLARLGMLRLRHCLTSSTGLVGRRAPGGSSRAGVFTCPNYPTFGTLAVALVVNALE